MTASDRNSVKGSTWMKHRTLTLRDVLALPAGSLVRVIDEEMILVDVRSREVLHFDPVATWFVRQLDGKRTLSAVLRRVVRRYKVDEATAKADLLELMEDLLSQGVLERVGAPP